MKKILVSFTVIMSLLPTLVLADTPQPEMCPGVAAIVAGGVSRNVIKANSGWFAGRRSMMYDTTDSWTFIMANINVPTASQAYNQASAALSSMYFQVGPFTGPLGKWVCLYNTAENYPAVTITTPIALAEAPFYFNH